MDVDTPDINWDSCALFTASAAYAVFEHIQAWALLLIQEQTPARIVVCGISICRYKDCTP